MKTLPFALAVMFVKPATGAPIVAFVGLPFVKSATTVTLIVTVPLAPSVTVSEHDPAVGAEFISVTLKNVGLTVGLPAVESSAHAGAALFPMLYGPVPLLGVILTNASGAEINVWICRRTLARSKRHSCHERRRNRH